MTQRRLLSIFVRWILAAILLLAAVPSSAAADPGGAIPPSGPVWWQSSAEYTPLKAGCFPAWWEIADDGTWRRW